MPSFGRTFIAAEVTVDLDLTYAPPSGLTISLMAPDGTSTPLAVGGGGRYTFSVPTFNNKLIEGQWLLRISNGRSGSAGIPGNAVGW